MARISTYVIDGSIVDGDKVIGSDANNSMITKNYTVGDLAAYIGYSIGNNYFVPYNNANSNVNLGSFNLTANSIIVGNQLVLGGTAGLVGQVLISNGSGSPASWGYNIGTQTLRDVLIQGNSGDKNLILSNNTTSAIALDLEKLYGANVGLYVFDNLLNSSSSLFPNKLDVQESSLQKTASYSASGIRYSSNGFNVDINPNTYANQTLLYPSGSGVLVTSVNGNLADLTGNITIPIGTGTVTSVAVTPGTGISASVANETTTPNITITNTAPDQVVILNEGAGIDITGTYPEFTIASTGSGTVPTLQEVTDAGNTTTNFILVEGTSANRNRIGITTPLNGGILLEFAPFDDNDASYLFSQYALGQISYTYTENYSTGIYGTTYINPKIDGTFTHTNNIYFPDASGTLALSVNGQTANDAGEITIPVGTGTVTSVAALTLGTSGTDLSSTIADSTTTPVITLNVPDASATNRGALLAADWTTFNDKQNALVNPVTGVGLVNEIAYFTNTGSTIASLTIATYPSLTELSYVKGVTSAIQTQLGAKQATITGAATTITSANLTASRALISNASGKVDISSVTNTELGYVSGVTSAIQTQLNSKGYTLTVTSIAGNMNNGLIYYFGNIGRSMLTTADISRLYIPKTGIIKKAYITQYSGTTGTITSITVSIRLNNTTDTLVATSTASAFLRTYNNNALSINVNEGDYIEIKVTSVSTVAPTLNVFGGTIYIE